MRRLLEYIFAKKRDEFTREAQDRFGAYEFPEGVLRIPNVRYDKRFPEQKMDVYRPEGVMNDLPVIVNVHGGGFVAGNKEYNMYFCAQLAKLGFVVFCPEYRLIPKTDIYGQWDDIARAMDFIHDNATVFGADLYNVFAIGDHSGAQLLVYNFALQKNRRFVGTIHRRPTKLEIKAVCYVNGMFYTTKLNDIGLLLPNYLYGNHWRSRGISRFTNPGYRGIVQYQPPCFMVCGADDRIRHESYAFMRDLAPTGVDHEICLYANKGFNAAYALPICEPDDKTSRSIISDIAKYFNTYYQRW